MDFQVIKDKMEKTVGKFTNDVSTIRTGRANAGLLDRVFVDYYGCKTPLRDIAKITVPEPRQLLITPYEENKKILDEIKKGIFAANVGLTPSDDGKTIRLQIQPLTEERRKEFVKLLNKFAEENKVALRNIRRDYMEISKKDKGTSEDQRKRDEKEIQKILDEFTKKIEDLSKVKEKELLTV
jgi:ribosome recycling factor